MSQKARKILEIVGLDGETNRFYVRLNPDRTRFMLYVTSDKPMSDDMIVDLIGLFVDEREGLALDGADFGNEPH